VIDEAVSIAAALCRRFEGFRASPYLCPAGVPTIGYGATHYENGAKVTLKDPAITKDRAELLLRHMIESEFMPGVLALCQAIDSPARLAAITDFAFNLGLGALKTSTLRRCINADQWDRVPQQLMRWNKAGGKVLPGLTARRMAESALI
jgi:lysozyme